jgi:hypothetical protein
MLFPKLISTFSHYYHIIPSLQREAGKPESCCVEGQGEVHELKKSVYTLIYWIVGRFDWAIIQRSSYAVAQPSCICVMDQLRTRSAIIGYRRLQ